MCQLLKSILFTALIIFAILLPSFSKEFPKDISSLIEPARKRYETFNDKIKDMCILQETKVTSPMGEMTSETKILKKRKKFRIENSIIKPISRYGEKTVVVYDGKETWIISSVGKRQVPPEQSKEFRVGTNWWELIPSQFGKIIIKDIEEINGYECFVVILGEKEGQLIRKMWINIESLSLVKVEGVGTDNEAMIWCYSDFRKVSKDWEMSFKTEIYKKGSLFSTIFIKSFEINKGLSDELFDVNKMKGFDLIEIIKQMVR